MTPVIDIFKVKIGIAPEIVTDAFDIIENPYSLYSFQNVTHFKTNNVRAGKYGIENPSFLGQRVWNIAPNKCKNLSFKQKLRISVQENCPSPNSALDNLKSSSSILPVFGSLVYFVTL